MIELMKDPNTLMNMSIGQKMMGSLNVALLGLGTCFVVLGILIICINIMHRKGAGNKNDVSKTVEAQKPAAVEAAKAPVAAESGTADGIDPGVVVAIAAAIAMLKGDNGFRIVNIVPSENKEAWVEAGRARAFANRTQKNR